MTAKAEIVLDLLIKRLEQEGWSDRKFAGGYWVDDEKGKAESQRRLNAGFIHFHQALRTAREALASGNPELMESAAYHCLVLESEGRGLVGKYALAEERFAALQEVTEKRRNGGLRRGGAQTAKARERYSQYLPQYRKMRAEGKTHSTAVKIIRDRMENPVSTRTLGDWMKKLEGS